MSGAYQLSGRGDIGRLLRPPIRALYPFQHCSTAFVVALSRIDGLIVRETRQLIHLHATRKLFAKLPVDDAGWIPVTNRSAWHFEESPLEDNPLGDWHGNLLTIQRRQCVLLVHDQTRFPVFIPALTKPDFRALNDRFADAFMNTLLKCDADEQQMDTARGLLRPLLVDSHCNRSVQGTMNRMAFEIENMLIYKGINVAEITGYRMGAHMADAPYSVKGRGNLWPQREMLALLERF